MLTEGGPEAEKAGFLRQRRMLITVSVLLSIYITAGVEIKDTAEVWGGVTVQTKIDPRDGRPKLMEVNPRLGVHLWYRSELGLNEPLACLQLARGETVAPLPPPADGCLLLKPIEDLVGLPFELLDRAAFDLRRIVPGGRLVDPSNPPVAVGALFGSYLRHYLAPGPKRYSPQSRHLLDDPLPGLLWALETLASYSGQVLAGKFGR